MKAIIFDPLSGASGDMTIAALIDLGANADSVKDAMEGAADVEVEVTRTTRKGISAAAVNVFTIKESSMKLSEIIERIRSLNLADEVISDAISVFNILGKAEAKVHGVHIGKLHFHELGQEDAIADILLVEWLAFRMDERRALRWLKIDELGEVPEVKLHDELPGLRPNVGSRQHAIFQLPLKFGFPAVRPLAASVCP